MLAMAILHIVQTDGSSDFRREVLPSKKLGLEYYTRRGNFHRPSTISRLTIHFKCGPKNYSRPRNNTGKTLLENKNIIYCVSNSIGLLIHPFGTGCDCCLAFGLG